MRGEAFPKLKSMAAGAAASARLFGPNVGLFGPDLDVLWRNLGSTPKGQTRDQLGPHSGPTWAGPTIRKN